MSYLEFTSPNIAGYKESAYPESSYSSAPSDKAGTFTELSPHRVEDGVGPYHINHFIAYFTLDKVYKSPMSWEHFFQNFPEIFNRKLLEKGRELIKNEAFVTKSKYQFKNNPTVQFISSDQYKMLLHQDWVSLQTDLPTKTFFGRTLKREWKNFSDDELVNPFLKFFRELAKSSGLDIPLDNEYLMGVNRRHFLAGRRSWTAGKLPSSKLYYVETAAFERYSHILYQAAEGAMGFRESIVNIWTKLILNFASFYGAELEFVFTKEDLLSGYTQYKNTNIIYNQAKSDDPAEVLNLPWFAEVSKRHPGLLIQ